MAVDVEKLKGMSPPAAIGFQIRKLGHVVLQVSDLEKSTEFYTRVLGFKVSDVYPEAMMPGGMVFLRCNTDHHCLALVGAGAGSSTGKELHHFAFEVATLGEVLRARDRLRAHNVPIDFEGRRRAGCQIAVEFRDPDNHAVEIYWGLDQVGSDGRVRPAAEWRGARSLEAAIADPVPGQDTSLPERERP
ncbi:MAG TPA: VOC family protein [candidate division Zixibacteria bacterium]|nr:VOC family protein [candidate division Zixibacteria bacterium]